MHVCIIMCTCTYIVCVHNYVYMYIHVHVLTYMYVHCMCGSGLTGMGESSLSSRPSLFCARFNYAHGTGKFRIFAVCA